MAVSPSDFSALMKTRYTRKKIEDLSFKRNPTLAILPKTKDFTGDSMKVPVIGGNPQGIGATFLAAQGNKTVGSQVAFAVTRTSMFGMFSIKGETLLAADGGDGSFMSAKFRQMDGIYKGVSKSLAVHAFRDGTGVIGKVSAGSNVSSAGGITLATLADHHNFQVGMKISLSVDKAAYRNPTTDANGDARGAAIFVKSVNRETGVLTFATTDGGSAVSLDTGIAAAAASDYIVRDGDLNKVISGLDAWVPSTAPGSTAFFGVDRTPDVQKYAGVRYSNVGGRIEETLITLATNLADVDADPDYCVMNFANFAQLEIELGAKKTYAEVMGEDYDGNAMAGIGFNALKVRGPTGDIMVVPDQNCQADRIYVLQKDTWELASLGELPRVLNLDGSDGLRESGNDAYETRIGGYTNLICHAPGYNGVALIA